MQKNTYIFNERGTVLMMVIIASIILSIIGIASISLSGLQQIAARAEVDVQRANEMADAGLEYGKMWISSRCISTELFPENLTVPPPGNRNSISLGTISFGSRGSCAVSITPDRLNDVDLLISCKSVIGTYTISSTATISTGATGTMDTTKNKTCQVRLWYTLTISSGPVMTTGRYGHTATPLPNGKVLIAGGNGSGGSLANNTAELYDPVANTFTATATNMFGARFWHTATLLLNGYVLLAGGLEGSELKTTELFDPAGGGVGSFTAGPEMTSWRALHNATLLNNGKVLIAGGGYSGNPYLDTAELYDPVVSTFTAITARMTSPRSSWPTATRLPNGKVLITGGQNGVNFLSSAELYDPVVSTFTATPDMTSRRYRHSATMLLSGKVLVAGGYSDGSTCLDSAELYDYNANTFTATPAMTCQVPVCTGVLFPGRNVFVYGLDGGGALQIRLNCMILSPINLLRHP
ncbi:MAG: kelch repeat-containing protein [Elusimicrobiota bacterium]